MQITTMMQNRGRGISALFEPALTHRLVQEVANDRAKRTRQDERCQKRRGRETFVPSPGY